MASFLSSNESRLSKPRTGCEIQLKTNDITDDYEILYGTILGRGANGFVFACTSKTSREMYAVKILAGGMISRMEAYLHWQACGSNFIVNIEDVYENIRDGQPSLPIIMEYMAGGNLGERITAAGRFTERQAVPIVKQIVAALTHLHAMSVVHCDVKPDNLLFKTETFDSPLKLTDFSLASLITTEDVLQSHEGRIFYMYHPPEVLRGEKMDTPCDMWALGCTIYIILSGSDPFNLCKGHNVAPAMQPSPHGGFTFPETQWSHISPEAKDLITRLLNIDPKRRMSLDQMRVHPWMTGNGMNYSSNPVRARQASPDNSHYG